MRLVEVARKLGMTGQELRRELSQVDFGVKASDREIPDQLAHGVIRFVANKYGIEIKEDDAQSSVESSQAATQTSSEQNESGSIEDDDSNKTDTGVSDTPKNKPDNADKDEGKKVHVLRKLSLDDVSDEAVRVQQAAAIRPQSAQRKRGSKFTRAPIMEKRGHDAQEQIKKKEGIVELPETITVKEFAEKTGIQVPAVISALMKNGVMATINQHIDYETAEIIAADLNVEVNKTQYAVSAERLMAGNLEALLKEDDLSRLKPRAPIITVMGHVDHGKTAILDSIRKTDVVAGEAGGITQKIGAYQVEHHGKQAVFIDTPGHEAFTAMRARGAQITDIVVLVVSADEGVKPTTIEAINHAKDAEVPIIVAINKIDSERSDPDRVKGELAQHGLQPEEWGGKTPIVLCSAKTGQGIENLLEHILLLAEMEDLKANPDRSAVATVIESHLDPSLGPVATVVLNAGFLSIADVFVCGTTSGKVKLMKDSHGARIDRIGPSGVVQISGYDIVPETGDILQAVEDEQEARKLIEEIRTARERQKKRGIGDLISRLSEGKITVLKVVLKADSQGSLEAIEGALSKLRTETGIIPKVIHAAVGAITESDVMMAAASDGIVLGFDVPASSHVERIASREGVQIRVYDIIYKLLDDVVGLLEGLVESEEAERIVGHLEVRGIFFRKRSDQVVGGKITDGILKRVPFRILRNGAVVGEGRITSLRHVEKDVKEAKEGKEYGLRIETPFTIEEGDVIEGYVKEFRKKTSA